MIVQFKSVDIRNEADLVESISLVNENLQAITDYLSENQSSSQRIRFPRGYLGTTAAHSKKFPWIINPILLKNLSYQYIFLDVLRWISNRTDLMLVARHMLYKHAIVIVASISESVLASASKQLGHHERRPLSMTKKFYKEEIINKKLYEDLGWLWNIRNRIHLHLVDEIEFEKYNVDDVRKALATAEKLEEKLIKYFETRSTVF